MGAKMPVVDVFLTGILFAIAMDAKNIFLSNILPLRTHTSAVIFGIYKLSLVSFSPMQTCYPSSPFAEALECRGQWKMGSRALGHTQQPLATKHLAGNVSLPKKEALIFVL